MGCGCSTGTGQGIANFVFMFERFGTAIALTMIVTCLMITTVGMLALGVGLGYNYCYVDFRVKRLFDDNKQPRRFLSRKKREAGNDPGAAVAFEDGEIDIKPNMIVSLKNNMSFFAHLISRMKELNMNVTLELVAC